jgi:hypothetical protein
VSNSDPQTHKRESGRERETERKAHTHIQRDTHTQRHMYTSSVAFFFLREFLASFETAAKKLPPSPSSLLWSGQTELLLDDELAAHIIAKKLS